MGSDWATDETLNDHTRAILAVMDDPSEQTRLLDFGCGWGATFQHLLRHGPRVHYTGIDINEDAIREARTHFGATFLRTDIRETPLPAATWDYAIANGVFTRRTGVEYGTFVRFMTDTIKQLWHATRIGVAWNVLSDHVDYRTDDWFHVPFDLLAHWLTTELGCRCFRFDNTYSPWGYTIHAYHQETP